MNTSAQSAPCNDKATSVKTFVDTMVGIGQSWAAFGLKVGKTALITSAETLGKTAETLESLAVAIEKKAAAAAAEPAPTVEAAAAEPAAAPADESPEAEPVATA
ncbi:MAG: hypothetical protein R3B70_48540 [Polyangiaceae bacterium]